MDPLPGDTVVLTTDGITVNGALQSHSLALASDLKGQRTSSAQSESLRNRRDYVWLVAPTERRKRRSNFFRGGPRRVNSKFTINNKSQDPHRTPIRTTPATLP